MSPAESTNIRDAIDTCFKGSRILHIGYCFHDNKTVVKGMELMGDGLKIIDQESVVGRDVLLQFFDSDDPDIVVLVSAALIQSHTKRARQRLKHIYDTCVSEHWFSALNLLFFKGSVNICDPDPRFLILNLECGSEWLDERPSTSTTNV